MTIDMKTLPALIEAAVENAIGKALAPIMYQIVELRKFVDRQINEISLDIERIETNDSSIKDILGDVREELSVLTETEDGEISPNSGMELESVVKYTEVATLKILDSAERIIKLMTAAENEIQSEQFMKISQKIQEEANSIIQETEFQDIIGQKIRIGLSRLSEAANKLDLIQPKRKIPDLVIDTQKTQMDQSAIDDLFK